MSYVQSPGVESLFARCRKQRSAALVAGILALSGGATAFPPYADAETEPLDGLYTRTIIDAGDSRVLVPGNTAVVRFTPCGPDCTHWCLECDANSPGFNLYRQGDKWMKTDDDSIVIIDSGSLKGSFASTSGLAYYMTFQLTKIS